LSFAAAQYLVVVQTVEVAPAPLVARVEDLFSWAAVAVVAAGEG
jgi:hypothetical protein